MAIASTNPATEELIQTFDEFSDREVDEALKKTYAAFQEWSHTLFAERARLLNEAATVLENKKQAWATLMTQEMGKPLKAAIAEVEKCTWVCRYYAENGEALLADERVETNASKSYVAFQPLGVVLAIMPWNFPFWQVFRFAAPALIAGNTSVLKHASNVPQCALAIEAVFREAGFPVDIFRTLLIGSANTDRIIADSRIAAVTLTGSSSAGSTVAATAGKAVKKCVLELGGSDPFIVLADADIEKAALTAVTARMVNTGQSCIAAKRFIVASEVYDAFTERFVERVKELKIGDPMNMETDLGPLARADLRDVLHAQVEKTVALGATCLTGGKKKTGKGFFYEPTVVKDVRKGMPLFDEETFGPVAAIIKATSEDNAIALANDTIYGLGAALWTGDKVKGERLARAIDAGAIFVNGQVVSDPRLPFGGIKASGFGRELGKHGIQEFVNKKTIWVS